MAILAGTTLIWRATALGRIWAPSNLSKLPYAGARSPQLFCVGLQQAAALAAKGFDRPAFLPLHFDASPPALLRGVFRPFLRPDRSVHHVEYETQLHLTVAFRT